MIQTIPDLRAPSADEYGIFATFDAGPAALLVSVQERLSAVLGSVIWLTPPRALHSTLMEVICDHDYGKTSRQDLFADWYARYDHAVRDVMVATNSLDITFDSIEASPRAIIAKASDSQQFNRLRSELLQALELPVGTKMPPDITHCTLARFSVTTDLEAVRRAVKDITINCMQQINRFSILKDLGPPTFSPYVVDQYQLGKM